MAPLLVALFGRIWCTDFREPGELDSAVGAIFVYCEATARSIRNKVDATLDVLGLACIEVRGSLCRHNLWGMPLTAFSFWLSAWRIQGR